MDVADEANQHRMTRLGIPDGSRKSTLPGAEAAENDGVPILLPLGLDPLLMGNQDGNALLSLVAYKEEV